MYVLAREVADTRDHTLHNFLAASTACVEAGERMTKLCVRAARDAIDHGGRQLAQLANGGKRPTPTVDFWLGGQMSNPAQLLEEAFGIVNDTYVAFVEAAKAQIRACDQLAVTAIDRTARSTPWEGGIALSILRNTVQGVENTLQSLTNTLAQTSDAASTPARRGKAQ